MYKLHNNNEDRVCDLLYYAKMGPHNINHNKDTRNINTRGKVRHRTQEVKIFNTRDENK